MKKELQGIVTAVEARNVEVLQEHVRVFSLEFKQAIDTIQVPIILDSRDVGDLDVPSVPEDFLQDRLLLTWKSLLAAKLCIYASEHRTPLAELASLYRDSLHDSFLYSQFKFAVECVLYGLERHRIPIRLKDQLAYETMFLTTNKAHLESDNIWLADLSFFAPDKNTQSQLGESKKSNKEYPDFHLGQLLQMKPLFWSRDNVLMYFNSIDKKPYKTRNFNGELVRIADQGRVDAGNYQYILTFKGGFYVVSFTRDAIVAHSVVRAGQPVICAGDIEVNAENVITKINNYSGHYETTDYNYTLSLMYMFEQGYIGMDCVVEFEGTIKMFFAKGTDEPIEPMTFGDILFGVSETDICIADLRLSSKVKIFIDKHSNDIPKLQQETEVEYAAPVMY